MAACPRVCYAAMLVSPGSEKKMGGVLRITYVIGIQVTVIHKTYGTGIQPAHPRPIVHHGNFHFPFWQQSIARVGAIGTEVREFVPRRYIPSRSLLDIVANNVYRVPEVLPVHAHCPIRQPRAVARLFGVVCEVV